MGEVVVRLWPEEGGQTIRVSNMAWDGIEEHSKHAQGGRAYLSHVTEVVDAPVAYHTAAAKQTILGHDENQAARWGWGAEQYMLDLTRAEWMAVHKDGGRCIVVMDLSDFPVAVAYVDHRDQLQVLEDDDDNAFLRDIAALWNVYDPTRCIPLLVANSRASQLTLLLVKHTFEAQPNFFTQDENETLN